MTRPDPAAAAPVLSVTRGNPTPDELAVVTVLLSALGAEAPPADPPASAWSAQTRARRTAPRPGPDAWRLSTRT
ncbi:MAG: acyl-CoA carboxylase subunit epsilon [Actinomycetia bacterium]|nr:acyl-CoA carboxylase subunit epsilon [Actinomycetes bacterium]